MRLSLESQRPEQIGAKLGGAHFCLLASFLSILSLHLARRIIPIYVCILVWKEGILVGESFLPYDQSTRRTLSSAVDTLSALTPRGVDIDTCVRTADGVTLPVPSPRRLLVRPPLSLLPLAETDARVYSARWSAADTSSHRPDCLNSTTSTPFGLTSAACLGKSAIVGERRSSSGALDGVVASLRLPSSAVAARSSAGRQRELIRPLLLALLLGRTAMPTNPRCVMGCPCIRPKLALAKIIGILMQRMWRGSHRTSQLRVRRRCSLVAPAVGESSPVLAARRRHRSPWIAHC